MNVVPIRVPPLRERASDIPLLVEHFSQKICRREAFRPKAVSPSAMDRLMSYHWPGNVRQLEHVIEPRGCQLWRKSGDRPYLGDIQLPDDRPAVQAASHEIDVPMTGVNFEQVIGQVERLLIQEALRKCDGNKAKAARVLGLKRTTMLYKSKAHEAMAV